MVVAVRLERVFLRRDLLKIVFMSLVGVSMALEVMIKLAFITLDVIALFL